MSISSVKKIKKAKENAQNEVTLLMEEKLLYVLQQTYSVSESYIIARSILNPNVPFDDLDLLVTEMSPDDDDYEDWDLDE